MAETEREGGRAEVVGGDGVGKDLDRSIWMKMGLAILPSRKNLERKTRFNPHNLTVNPDNQNSSSGLLKDKFL